MLCSICGQIEIVLQCSSEAATCDNGHVHCEKCLQQVNEKCLICGGRLYEYNTWASVRAVTRSWSPEMINEWSNQNESISADSLGDDMGALADDCEDASMNLLYSRGEAYEADSLQQSDSINLSDTKWNHPLMWNNVYAKHHQFFDVDPKCSKTVEKHLKADETPQPEKKDTRQNLVEQTKEEIRKKIMDDIFKSYTLNQKPELTAEEYSYIKQLRTVGVSTESTPKLLADDSLMASSLEPSNEMLIREENIDKQSLYNKAPAEFLLMNVDTGSVKTPCLQDGTLKKSEASCIDQKLQQIMGILLESVAEKPPPSKEDQHFYKFLREKFSRMPLNKLEEIISSIYNEGDNEKSAQEHAPSKKEVTPEKPVDTTLVANCRRAFYNPPDESIPDITPKAQFQLITLCNLNISTELLQMQTIDAGSLNIPRRPVICPISTCQRAFFVSDFTKHIAVDHTKVPMERIFPQQCKNFFLDPKLIHFGMTRCQVLLLVKNKIMNLGHEKYKDFIPILVMTTKLSLLEICSNKFRPQSEEVRKSTQNFVMIWLTGIMPPQLPIFFSLTVWARSGPMPACHLVHSGRLYSVRESQSPEAVRQSGQMLLLSDNQIDLLTNGGRHMLELQISVH